MGKVKGYANAKDVLPEELFRELVKYHTGILYVSEGMRHGERRRLVIAMHRHGASGKEISYISGLSVRRVSQIIREYKTRTGEMI